MRNDHSNNQQPQKPVNENTDPKGESDDFFEMFLVFIIGVLFLPIFIIRMLMPVLYSNSKTWQVFEWRRNILLSTFGGLVLSFFEYQIISKSDIHPTPISVSILLILFWIFMSPFAFWYLIHNLKVVEEDIDKGVFSVHHLSSTKKAILDNSFSSAWRKFKKLNFLIPLRTESGKSVIGISANPIDHRRRYARKTRPFENQLMEHQDGDFIITTQRPESPTSQLVIGSTGSGKTRLLSRMALSALADNWRVVIIDFKGGTDEKQIYSSLLERLNDSNASVNHRVKNFPGEPIDLFRGSKNEIADKLISCLPPQTNSDGDYYRQRAVRAIQAVITRSSAPAPVNIDEVIKRIRNGASYADDELDREMFSQKERGVPVGQILAEAIGARFEPMRRGGEWGTSGGFSWEDDWDLAVFSFDATNDLEVKLGDLILLDFDIWLQSVNRERNPRPILLICDEAGALNRLPDGTKNLVNIVARGRSKRVGAIVSSQTLTSLGLNYAELNQQIAIKWLGRMANPEELINTIGTKSVMESTYEYSERGWNLPKSGRVQRGYIVEPDTIRQLPTFFWNLSEGGKTAYVFAPPLDYK